MIPAFFPERDQADRIDLSARAGPLRDAIWHLQVHAYAPPLLASEFVKAAYGKCSSREGAGSMDRSLARAACDEFLMLLGIPSSKPRLHLANPLGLAPIVMNLLDRGGISPTDVWFVACAIEYKAELWISERHKDGFVEAARKVLPKVYLLTENKFASG